MFMDYITSVVTNPIINKCYYERYKCAMGVLPVCGAFIPYFCRSPAICETN